MKPHVWQKLRAVGNGWSFFMNRRWFTTATWARHVNPGRDHAMPWLIAPPPPPPPPERDHIGTARTQSVYHGVTDSQTSIAVIHRPSKAGRGERTVIQPVQPRLSWRGRGAADSVALMSSCWWAAATCTCGRGKHARKSLASLCRPPSPSVMQSGADQPGHHRGPVISGSAVLYIGSYLHVTAAHYCCAVCI